MPLLFEGTKTIPCAEFTKGDKYGRSVEDVIANSDGMCFLVVKCGNHWDVTKGTATKYVAPAEKKDEVEDAIRTVSKERSGTRSGGRKTGRRTSSKGN